MFYVSSMVTTKKIHTKDTLKKMRKKSKHVTTTEINETQQERKRGTKKLQDKKTMTKMAIVSPSLSIVTLNVNGFNSSIQRQSEKKKHIYRNKRSSG